MKWIILLLISFNAFSQTTDTEKMLEHFLEQRRKMMEQVRKAFKDDDMMFDNFFDDDDFFKDFSDGQMKGFRGRGPDFSIEEQATHDGNIEFLITPKNKNVTLDIDTQDNQIVIKSETKVTEENQGQHGTSQSFSSSSYSRVIGIPFGYKATDPVAEGDSIKITLQKTKPNDNGRVPISKPKDGETL